MAENKITARHDFPEVNGKIVDAVELVVEPDYYGIAIRFQDKTALNIALESAVFAFPVFEDWTQGEAKIIRKYEPAQSAIQRT